MLNAKVSYRLETPILAAVKMLDKKSIISYFEMVLKFVLHYFFNQDKIKGKEFTIHPATTVCFDMLLKLFGW